MAPAPSSMPSEVPIVPDTFIVNIGDLMARWTGDRWVSTLHRVVDPSSAQARDSHRLSSVFFHQPNYDAVIDEICPSATAAAKYAPTRSSDYCACESRKPSAP